MKVLLVEQLFKLSNRQTVGMDGGGKFFGIHRVQVVERLDPWKDGGSGVRRLLLPACPMPEGRECFFGMKTLLSFSDEDREKRQRHIKKRVKASMTLKQMAYSCGFLAKIIFLKKSQKRC